MNSNQEGKISWTGFAKSFKSFEWDDYLKSTNAAIAGPECFNQNAEPPINEFQLKQKLEINSFVNNDFVHLATIISFIGPRLQLRLDGCDTSNDIYELVDSEAINPINTHKTKNRYFAAPLRFRKDAASYYTFCKNVLKNAVSAPQSAFKKSPSPPKKNLFKPGMKLEAVDIKHPSNICPATIVDVESTNVTIHLDGWDQTNDFQCKYTSRNLFPVGWCKKTGYPLQPPGPKESLKVSINSDVNNTQTTNNVNNNNNNNGHQIEVIEDQVASLNSEKDVVPNIVDHSSDNTLNKEDNHVKNSQLNITNTNPNENGIKIDSLDSSPNKIAVAHGVKRDHSQMNNDYIVEEAFQPQPLMKITQIYNNNWLQNNIPDKSIVETWTVDNVIAFLNSRLSDFHKYESQFRSQEIDGKAFLLLTNELIMKFLNIKLGFSLKIVKLVEEINSTE